MGARRKVGAGAAVIALVAAGAGVLTAPGAAAADWSRCLDGTTDRQAVFARAASVSGVPAEVLLGVSYMESRWDDHGDSPSTSTRGPVATNGIRSAKTTKGTSMTIRLPM
mgnify:CR=1 FL=1